MAEETPGRGAEMTNKEQNAKNHSKTSTTSSTRRPPWCLHSVKSNLHHQHGTLSDDEVTLAGPTTNEEETRGVAMLVDTRDENAELTELNNRELTVLQCSAAVIIGVLCDGVKGLQGCLEGRKAGYSWWTLFKYFVVAAGLVFCLRIVIYMLKRTPELSDRTSFTLVVDAAFKDTVNLKQLFQVAAAAVLWSQATGL
ncbi:uncharacterized protein LOC112340519 [Selaginella moellendorffii]|uniref:uncharacterized protein LOC112340519 n=1 Tax=Selaginella moellendorffii TaxID=88036 RepID=UPI000D1C46EC|nr:uncharacterized protein LOC112340519 [Selaginella moellendorffii]|eukprot:XP_024514816.1 uncharacterized protein LOC112340519 [Selaginella moellendorffii]